MSLYVLTHEYDDAGNEFGISGEATLIGVFTSRKKAEQWILDEYDQHPGDSYFRLNGKQPTLKNLMGNPYGVHFKLTKVEPDQAVEENIADWYYTE